MTVAHDRTSKSATSPSASATSPPSAISRLDIAEGEFVCFLGPSGCGKTTLLRAIAGLDPQTSGTIHQKGRDVSALPPAKRDFGIVFQSYALFPNLTVTDNVGYGLVSRRQSRADDRASASTSCWRWSACPTPGRNIPPSFRAASSSAWRWPARSRPRPACCCSTSRCRRSMRACACACATRSRRCSARLGVTTIMVTHDQEEALTMADRIVVMNQGAIEQVGTPQEIYRRPATAFVADFVGSMNFLAGTLLAPDKVKVAGLTFDCPPQDGLAPGSKVRAVHPARGRARARPAGRRRQPRRASRWPSSISSAPSAAPR